MFGRLFRFGQAVGLPIVLVSTAVAPVWAEESGRRQIEEVVVTAERKESTVSDTSISITAFTGQMLEDFGIRNQEDLQNYIPAAVIEPYDMAIRGVGRNFRALGGDPGIATYLNGVYSEDFGIASTEGGLFDIERIEVLRGPQGTLYGRNAIGGAVNFINKLPTDEFEGEARVVMGDYDLQETYGVLSGPVIKDLLSARVTGVKRTRDGYFQDIGPADDAGNYGDENYALALRLTPTDNIEINTRGNERSYRRRMGGADAAGIVVFGENGTADRDTSTYAWGYRAVDPGVPCANAFTRTAVVATPGVKGGVGCTIAGRPTFSFTNPLNGTQVTAQRNVAGVDSSGVGTSTNPNRIFGQNPSNLPVLGYDNLDSDDLRTATNGAQDEYFDHQASSFDINWQLNDKFATKYIFGYTDYFYDRTTDNDLSFNQSFDRQFYVSQETEYVSHELQFFYDPTDQLSITTGLFYYDAKITQRGDFYDATCIPGQPCASTYANNFPIPYGAINPALGFLDVLPKMDLFTAQRVGERFKDGNPRPFNCISLQGIPQYCFGSWRGDTGDRVTHGRPTVATDLEYETRSEREAFAAYTQGVYSFNEQWALTLGVRWAKDVLDGNENLFYYSEGDVVALDFAPTGGASPLQGVNMALGWIDAAGNILNPDRLLNTGLPTSQSLWRELEREDDEVTWRVNVDYTPSDAHLIYLSATKGYRAGGFNLVFFSANATYEPEDLIAYELGYKGSLLDGSMQLNSALYFYDYSNIHTFGDGPSAINPANPSTSVYAVPGAEMIGWDADVMWLATDRITLGANFSYTHSEYTEDFIMIDANTPTSPNSLFNSTDRPININGNQMLRVPEMKGGGWAQYSYPLGDNGQIELFGSWTWIDQVYFSAFEEEDDSAEAYSRTDVRVSWISVDESWTVAGFVNNVFDEIGIRQVEQGGESTNYLRAGVTTDPRLYGLEVRFKFGAFK